MRKKAVWYPFSCRSDGTFKAWRESIMTMRKCALLATVMLLAGCATEPSITVKHRVPHGSTVAVVMFEDCTIANQSDCDGSGSNASSIFVRVLSQKPGLHAVSLPRPVGPKAQLDDAAAVAYAKAKGYRYVINGEVQDYSRTGHIALRSNRASISVRVLGTSNGQELATYTYQEDSKTHFTTPDEMLEDMAKQLAASIVVEPKKQHQGDFLFYKGSG
jgi:TolB-like protein